MVCLALIFIQITPIFQLIGVNGILQSMLLSIGGIRFRNHHLEMNLDPTELHRDMFFRSIHFGKQYYLNISITVGHDNRAVIDVSINNEDSNAYACDAGCLDTPTKLGFVWKERRCVKLGIWCTEKFD